MGSCTSSTPQLLVYQQLILLFLLCYFSTRVSNELGAGRPQAARLAVRVAVAMVATEGILVATIMIVGRNVWGYCYSKEEEVVRYVAEMLILIAISHFFDGLQSVFSGLWQTFSSAFCSY